MATVLIRIAKGAISQSRFATAARLLIVERVKDEPEERPQDAVENDTMSW